MAGVESEAIRITKILRQTQHLIGESSQGIKNVSTALTSQLTELTREIEIKLENQENINERKLGVLFAFLALHHIESDAPAYNHILKFFDNKNSRIILKLSKVDDEVLKKVQEYVAKPQEVVSWVTLPQPGSPGSMSISKGSSFVKKVVSINKNTGGGDFGSVLEDRFTQPITQDLLDKIPDPAFCIFFRLGNQAPTVKDFNDKYQEEEEDDLQRNNDLDDMF